MAAPPCPLALPHPQELKALTHAPLRAPGDESELTRALAAAKLVASVVSGDSKPNHHHHHRMRLASSIT